MRITAGVLIVLSLINLNNALALSGSDLAISYKSSPTKVSENTVSETTIEFYETSYSPDSISVKAGSPVTLRLKNVSGSGCIQSFKIPKLGVQKIVSVGSEDVINFTAPLEKGPIAFMCSMGMYRGVINVL